MDRRIIIVRSDKCTVSTNDCNAQFVFPSPIVVPPGSDATVQLLKVSFGHSYYLINSHTDKLIVSGTAYTIEHGNYNAATMLRYLHDTLPISVRYSPRSYKFEFSSTSAFTIGSNSTCLEILGITFAQCDTSVTTLTSAHVADLHGLHSIKIRTGFFVDSYDSSSSNGRDPHLLARIPVQNDTHESSTFKYESYTPSTKYKMRVFDRTISEFTASLVDANNQHIEFNGIPFSVKVAIEITKRPGEQISPMILNNNAAQTWTPAGYNTEQTGDALSDDGAPNRYKETSPTTRKRRRPKRAAAKNPRVRPRKK